MHKLRQSRGFLGRLLVPLPKTGFFLMKNVLKPLAKSILIPLGLTATALAIYAAIQKKIFGSCTLILTISNEEMDDIMKKKIKFLEESGLLIKGVSKTIKNEAKKTKVGYLVM